MGASARNGKIRARVGPACFRRLAELHERLRKHERVSAVALAEQWGMSVRTVKRDLQKMRDELGAPVAWESSTRTYFYTAPFDLLSGLQLNADELLALMLASQTFAAWGKHPLGRVLTKALRKVAEATGSAVAVPVDDLEALLWQPEAVPEREHTYFLPLVMHIRRRNELRLSYLKPGAAEAEERNVQPLKLAYLEHRWVLVAQDLGRAGWRKFRLDRLRGLATTGRRFAEPDQEAIRQYLRGSLGRFTGEQEWLVQVTFSAALAPAVREVPWHVSQDLVDRTDGGVEASWRLNNLVDVRRRVLACGREAEVLAPPALRAAVAEELAAAAARYGPA